MTISYVSTTQTPITNTLIHEEFSSVDASVCFIVAARRRHHTITVQELAAYILLLSFYEYEILLYRHLLLFELWQERIF